MSDLIVGNEYYFRVFSKNFCGLSDSPGVSKNTAQILKTGVTAPFCGVRSPLWLGLGLDSSPSLGPKLVAPGWRRGGLGPI